ncbi:MAG: TlyA family RNA methyltransferase [Oscillatoriales cyanobacterium SM2_2_1]|nr:TlyA family RNA methyltransferase [Oscillatoriales cyanobacterium SM2_2_1]
MKQRLDLKLVELGLAPTREQAQKWIRAGWVQVDRQVLDKPGTEIASNVEIVVHQKAPYVSRGGEKLAGAIAQFQVAIAGRVALDGGISTGGFTDLLLQGGAMRVYGIDVGYGQVAWEIRSDPRVVLRERTNLRYLTAAELYGSENPLPDLAVLDLSFISLTKILPNLWHLLQSPRESLCLVKPQFEAGREAVGKHGLVRDRHVHAQVLSQVLTTAIAQGWSYGGMVPSPITGRTGNQEYWLRLGEGFGTSPPTTDSFFAQIEHYGPNPNAQNL